MQRGCVCPHHCPLLPPRTPGMDACPFLSRNPDGKPAPDGGTTSLAPRDARAGGVFGAAKFKTGAQSHRNRHLSHDWRGADGGGWAWWWWRLLLCPPL